MRRCICPPREALDELRTPLTDGETHVLDFFDRLLPEGWEIYVQPHLNGLRPDFVLLHPMRGIAVFEVKDWNLDAMPYAIRTDGSAVSLWCRNRDGKWFRRTDNPVERPVSSSTDEHHQSDYLAALPRMVQTGLPGGWHGTGVPSPLASAG